MGKRPKDKTIDRINVNKNYEPNNCKWSTQIEQHNNRSNNRRLTIDGETKTIAQWAKDTNQDYHVVHVGVYDYHITYKILWDAFHLKHCGPDTKDRRLLLTEAEMFKFVTPKLFPNEDNKHIGSSVDGFFKEEGIKLIRLCCNQEPKLGELWGYDEGRGYYMKCVVCGTKTAPYPDIKLAKDAWDNKILL